MNLKSLKRTFRIFITLEWTATTAAAIVFVASRHYLPVELTPYFESRRLLGVTRLQSVLFLIEILLFFLSVANAVGLFLFRRCAKRLLIPIYIVAISLLPTNAVYIQSGWTRMLYSISGLFGGMVVALVFFSPLAEVFELKLDNESSIVETSVDQSSTYDGYASEDPKCPSQFFCPR